MLCGKGKFCHSLCAVTAKQMGANLCRTFPKEPYTPATISNRTIREGSIAV